MSVEMVRVWTTRNASEKFLDNPFGERGCNHEVEKDLNSERVEKVDMTTNEDTEAMRKWEQKQNKMRDCLICSKEFRIQAASRHTQATTAT